MFGIGSTELLLILIVALLVLGPKSLASTARSVGKVVGQFRRVSTDFQRTLNAEVALEEEKEKRQKAEKEVEADLQQPAARADAKGSAQATGQADAQSGAQPDAQAGAHTDVQAGEQATTAGPETTGAAATSQAAAATNEVVAPPPGSPLEEALNRAAAEANAAELMEPVTVETAQAAQTAVQTPNAQDTQGQPATQNRA